MKILSIFIHFVLRLLCHILLLSSYSSPLLLLACPLICGTFPPPLAILVCTILHSMDQTNNQPTEKDIWRDVDAPRTLAGEDLTVSDFVTIFQQLVEAMIMTYEREQRP